MGVPSFFKQIQGLGLSKLEDMCIFVFSFLGYVLGIAGAGTAVFFLAPEERESVTKIFGLAALFGYLGIGLVFLVMRFVYRGIKIILKELQTKVRQ